MNVLLLFAMVAVYNSSSLSVMCQRVMMDLKRVPRLWLLLFLHHSTSMFIHGSDFLMKLPQPGHLSDIPFNLIS